MLPGQLAKDFKLPSFINGGKEETFSLFSIKNKYILMIFYPVDFGYVTPTEFYEVEKLLPEFAKADCEIVAISTENSTR